MIFCKKYSRKGTNIPDNDQFSFVSSKLRLYYLIKINIPVTKLQINSSSKLYLGVQSTIPRLWNS